MFTVNGILFNHESPLRGETFVTRKITRAVAKIALGQQSKLYLGNLDAQRDWGHAKDYVEAMWLMLQHETPDDYVVATGIANSVREFCRLAFENIGITLNFTGSGENEKGVVAQNIGPHNVEEGSVVVEVDPSYYRPTEVDFLLGDPMKIKEVLQWQPTYTFQKMVSEMVKNDLKNAIEKK